MSIIKTIGVYEFIDAFKYGRGDNFSREALIKLFDWYDELDEDYNLDVVARCCDWTEYESGRELWDDYYILLDGLPKNAEYDPERFSELLERVGDNTNYFHLDNGNYLVSPF